MSIMDVFGVIIYIVFMGAVLFFSFWACAVIAALGWIPILICAFSADFAIGTQYGFVGTFAVYALTFYALASSVIVVLTIVKPDPDGIPPAFKFLSYFYVYDAASIASKAAHTTSPLNTDKYRDALKETVSNWGYQNEVRNSQMKASASEVRKKASELKKENDKKEEAFRAADEITTELLNLEREKARAAAMKLRESQQEK